MCNQSWQHDWDYDYTDLTRTCGLCGVRDRILVTIRPTAVSMEVFADEPEEEEDGEGQE